MRKTTSATVSAIAGALVLAGVAAFAGAEVRAADGIDARPYTTGAGVSSTWVTHRGLPDAGRSDHGVAVSKATATATGSVAGVDFGVRDVIVDTAGFAVPESACGASPKLVLTDTEGVDHTFTCRDASTRSTVVDRRGLRWVEVRFRPRVLVSPLPIDLPAPLAEEFRVTARSVRVVFDQAGATVVDNFFLNGATSGKPGRG
jgi:hypothetical protein